MNGSFQLEFKMGVLLNTNQLVWAIRTMIVTRPIRHGGLSVPPNVTYGQLPEILTMESPRYGSGIYLLKDFLGEVTKLKPLWYKSV